MTSPVTSCHCVPGLLLVTVSVVKRMLMIEAKRYRDRRWRAGPAPKDSLIMDAWRGTHFQTVLRRQRGCLPLALAGIGFPLVGLVFAVDEADGA